MCMRVLYQKFAPKMNCHPERSLARFLRQTESKNLRFGLLTSIVNSCDTILGRDTSIPPMVPVHYQPLSIKTVLAYVFGYRGWQQVLLCRNTARG
jgi:hypothetical protein